MKIGNVCNSCTIYVVLFVIAFLTITGISSAYFYCYRYLKIIHTNVVTNINVITEAVIY